MGASRMRTCVERSGSGRCSEGCVSAPEPGARRSPNSALTLTGRISVSEVKRTEGSHSDTEILPVSVGTGLKSRGRAQLMNVAAAGTILALS